MRASSIDARGMASRSIAVLLRVRAVAVTLRVHGATAAFAALIALSGVAMPASAGGLDQLHEFLSQTHSARGDFSQKVQRSGRTLETTRGVFAFCRPGKFRWEVREPFEQLMVADGERLWFYDKDLNQVTIRKLGNALGSTPAAILFGSTELESGFALRELDDRDGLQWIEALPKNTDQGFDRIAIGLRNGLPEAMEVRDAFGRTSVFAFTDIERNPQLPDTLFRFTAPPGADVVEQ